MHPLSPPDFTGVQAEHLMQAMQQCEVGKGDEVLQHFESDFSHLVGSEYAVATSSATAGLHLALLALGVSEGDFVICPTFTFAASAFPILYQKAIPVFVDSEYETWNMSPEYLEEAILKLKAVGRKIKAAIVVHSYGNPAKINELLLICLKHKISIVEDAANALGSTYADKQVGTFGTIGVFSFNRNKIISAAGGGCLVTNDQKIADRARYLAHQAKSQVPYYQHETVGYNYGLSPLLSEIVRVQLPTLAKRILDRKEIAYQYQKRFTKEIFWQKETADSASNHWLNAIGCETEAIQYEIIALAKEANVEIRKVWKPMHLQPIFKNALYVGNKESELFFEKGLCLPFSCSLFEVPSSFKI